MVSVSGAWIIVVIIFVAFIIMGIVYWYFEFYQAYTGQIKEAASASNRGQPPPPYPAKTPKYTGS